MQRSETASAKTKKHYSGVVREYSHSLALDSNAAVDQSHAVEAEIKLIKFLRVVISKSRSPSNTNAINKLDSWLDKLDGFVNEKDIDAITISDVRTSLDNILDEILNKININDESKDFISARQITALVTQNIDLKIKARVNPQDNQHVFAHLYNEFVSLQAEVFAKIGDDQQVQLQLLPKLTAVKDRFYNACDAFDSLDIIGSYLLFIEKITKEKSDKQTYYNKGLKNKMDLLRSLRARLIAVRNAIRYNGGHVMTDKAKKHLLSMTKELAIITHHRRYSIMDNLVTLIRWLLMPVFGLGLLIKNRWKAESWQEFEKLDDTGVFGLEDVKIGPQTSFKHQLRLVYLDARSHQSKRTVAIKNNEGIRIVHSYNAYRELMLHKHDMALRSCKTELPTNSRMKSFSVTAADITSARANLHEVDFTKPPEDSIKKPVKRAIATQFPPQLSDGKPQKTGDVSFSNKPKT